MPGFVTRPYVPPKNGQNSGVSIQIYPPRPSGDPSAIRAGAPAWSHLADEMAALTRDIDAALANVTWKQGGRQALDKAWNQVKAGLAKGEKDYGDFASHLMDVANKIEQGQTTWDLGLAAIIATTAVGIALTIFTFGASDAAAAAIVATSVVAMDGALTVVAGAIGVSVEVLVAIIETALRLAIQFLIDFAINYTLAGISSLITTGKWNVDLSQVLLATTIQMVTTPIASKVVGLFSTEGWNAFQLAAFHFAVGAGSGLTFDLALQGIQTLLNPNHQFSFVELELATIGGGLGGLAAFGTALLRTPTVTDFSTPDFQMPQGTTIRPGVEVLPDGTVIVDSTGITPQLVLGDPHPVDTSRVDLVPSTTDVVPTDVVPTDVVPTDVVPTVDVVPTHDGPNALVISDLPTGARGQDLLAQLPTGNRDPALVIPEPAVQRLPINDFLGNPVDLPGDNRRTGQTGTMWDSYQGRTVDGSWSVPNNTDQAALLDRTILSDPTPIGTAGKDHANPVYRLDTSSGPEVYKPAKFEVGFDDGSTALRVGVEPGTVWRHEIAGYQTDHALGYEIVPTTARMDGEFGVGSVQDWIPDPPRPVRSYQPIDQQMVAVSDYIQGQTDGGHNWGTQANGRPGRFDVGLNYGTTTAEWIDSPFVSEWRGKPLDPSVLAPVRAIDPQAFADMLRADGIPEAGVQGGVARLREIQDQGMITGQAWENHLQWYDNTVAQDPWATRSNDLGVLPTILPGEKALPTILPGGDTVPAIPSDHSVAPGIRVNDPGATQPDDHPSRPPSAPVKPPPPPHDPLGGPGGANPGGLTVPQEPSLGPPPPPPPLREGVVPAQKAFALGAPSIDPTLPEGAVVRVVARGEQNPLISILNDHQFKDALLTYRSTLIEPVPGFTDVLIHGKPSAFEVADRFGGVHDLSAQQLLDVLVRHGYSGGPIRLLTCFSGAVDAVTGQGLANLINDVSLAPNRVLIPDDRLVVGWRANPGWWVTLVPDSWATVGGQQLDTAPGAAPWVSKLEPHPTRPLSGRTQ